MPRTHCESVCKILQNVVRILHNHGYNETAEHLHGVPRVMSVIAQLRSCSWHAWTDTAQHQGVRALATCKPTTAQATVLNPTMRPPAGLERPSLANMYRMLKGRP